MRALALQGRQTEALRAFQEFRTYLAEEAGVEPSSELVELEGQIISDTLEAPPTDPLPQPVEARASSALPTGTVTFLFTDIEGSTARWESAPHEMNDALESHDQQLRRSIERFQGWVFAHTGDGMCAAFSSAKAAVEAAIDAQQQLDLPVRMGIATGEAELREGNYFGPVLNRTARIMSAGHAGQILVAATTALMVDNLDFIDLGNHRLPDLTELMGIYQAQGTGLRTDFPPLKTDSRAIGNLPALAGEILGRSTEVQALSQLLETQRLVTLTGSGGVGKTSLAIHVANSLAFEFPDGLWWVELASVRDPSGVPDAVASALGITPSGDATVSESIATALLSRRVLIVLDNCEHVLDAAADLASTLLSGSQQLAVMATSREQLRIAGERVWTVPPLDYSGPESAAVQLFVQRARAVATDIDLESDLDTITNICARLDGVAFAIELAAARMMSMTPTDIANRLDDRFRLLTGGQRRGIEHQQTLRQTVQWSYELLESNEREALTRLAVFVDGFDLDGALTIAGGDLNDEYAMMDLVDSLVRKSLLTTERVHGHVRYNMLETIREFALDQLQASGDADSVHTLHARHFRTQADRHWQLWHGPDQRTAINWAETELANLRSAFRSSIDAADLETASAIAANTALLVQILMVYEPISWVEEVFEPALAANVPSVPSLRAAIGLVAMTGRPGAAVRYVELAGAHDHADTDPITHAWIEFNNALAYRYNDQGEAFLDGVRAMVRADGLARALGSIGVLCSPAVIENIDQARRLGNHAVECARELDNGYLLTYALAVYARAIAQWEPTETLAKMREATSIARNGRLAYWTASIARETAGLEAAHGNNAAALEHFATAFDSFQRMGNGTLAGLALANLSATFNAMNEPTIAATLYGCYRSHGSSMNAYLPGGLALPTIDDSDETLASAVETGMQMDFGEAMKYAREQIQNARDIVAAS